ncbi:MAG TPA: histone deacetylase [Bryobacteraceae bacterium]|nr:histone deacetylase [Bryobacteraceae bacterium]
MLPYRLVYHQDYDLNLGEHVFPSQKFRWIRERLLLDRIASEEDFVTPEPAADEDLLLVHEPAWIDRLKHGTLDYHQLVRLEIPYSSQTVRAFWLAAGGSILAARLAFEHGIGFNLGGGFHHAFQEHGEGFCAINDIAVAARKTQRDGLARRVMVVDCDVHHGNGTAAIFATDPSVFTLSIHQLNNYPAEKPPSSLDIHLGDGIGDDEYLRRLGEAYRTALGMFQPELVVYVAGADAYCEDQLGGLAMTLEGLEERDRLIMWTALQHHIPVMVVLAGGYAENAYDTVQIHVNTVRMARTVLERVGWCTRSTAG